MTKLGPNEKVYPVVKIAMVVESLRDEGVSSREALAGIHISETQLASPAGWVSPKEERGVFLNVISPCPKPPFFPHNGLGRDVAVYCMERFGVFSSTGF